MTDPRQHLEAALAAFDRGELPQAAEACRAARTLAPNALGPAYLEGLVAYAMGNLPVASLALADAVRLGPNHAASHLLRGTVAARRGDAAMAHEALNRALALEPGNAQGWHELGMLHSGQGRLESAEVAFRRALQCNPAQHESLGNLVLCVLSQGRTAEAASLLPSPLPPSIAAEAGVVLARSGRKSEAEAAFKLALDHDPQDHQARTNLARLYLDSRRAGDATPLFAQAHAGGYRPALDGLIAARLTACDWDGLDRLTGALLSDIPVRPIDPFLLMHLETTPAALRMATDRMVAPLRALAAEAQRPAIGPRPDRLRLGYLSSDFRQHALMSLVGRVFAAHDRTRFEVHCYGLGGDDGSSERRQVQTDADHWSELGGLSHGAAAKRIRRDGIDILIDLSGFSNGGKPEILAHRPAPVSVNWLGYAGTFGEGVADYIIADPVLIPPDAERDFGERVARLPYCYQPNARPPVPIQGLTMRDRLDAGLPKAGRVLAAFSTPIKLNAPLLTAWLEILRAVPDTVLWFAEMAEPAPSNLRAFASAKGIDPDRLVFAPKRDPADHLARLPHAVLALDTHPYGAHTTAGDMLWMGVPLIAIEGRSFAGRVSSSVVRAAGLRDLVVASIEEQAALAITLLHDDAKLGALRQRAMAARSAAPLFDMAGFVKSLEQLYDLIWDDARATFAQ